MWLLMWCHRDGDETRRLTIDNASGDIKRWEFGLQAGTGYQFKMKQKIVSLDFRYHYGVTDISRNQEIYNRYFLVSLKISSPWKKSSIKK